MNAKSIRKEILEKTKLYYRTAHKMKGKNRFIPGVSVIHYSGRVYDDREIVNLADSALEFWLTAGRYARRFEEKMRRFFNAEKFYLVNSGSSANLVMVSSLASLQLKGRLKAGDEIITPAVTFPTTLTPIIQNGFVPVFVDCEMGTYNMDAKQLESAIGPRTRAVFVPHTLGNPCDMDTIMAISKKHGLIVLEDACDGLGSTYDGALIGSFGSMASLSFYPAHHITMGEGGGIIVNDSRFSRIALSIRDWGRDCWCEPGHNNTCGKRFKGKFGDLPFGYDHKYVYSNLGYNLKVTDMQAAVGMAQFEKLKKFIRLRRENFNYFYNGLNKFQHKLILPKWHRKSNPAWFGFPITVKKGLDAKNLMEFLETSKIETRKIFAGNILRQPGFRGIRCRVHNQLKNSDMIMERSFFLGVHPGLTKDMKEFVVSRFEKFFKEKN